MKLAILGDTHFGGGYTLGKVVDPNRQINSRLVDYSNTFDYVVDYCVEQSIRHLVLTGDIFDHRRPHAVELSLFSEKVYRLSELGIHTHIVVGNHDLIYAHKSTTIDVLKSLKLPHVHIYSDIQSVECSDGTNEIVNLIMLPFRTRKMLKCSDNNAAIQRLSDVLQYELRGITKGAKILIGHLMVEGTKLNDGISEGYVGELVLPLKTFDGLDAVVMGHVHPHTILQKNPMITYVGSMERKKFDEGQNEKYFLVVDYKENKLKFNFEKLPVRNLFDIHIDQNNAKDNEQALEGIKNYMRDFAIENELFGSIVRLQIFMGEEAQYGFDKQKLDDFLKKELEIHHCVGIHTQITSKRQLRKDTITERAEPIIAFKEYMELEPDSPFKERMRELGIRIITERN